MEKSSTEKVVIVHMVECTDHAPKASRTLTRDMTEAIQLKLRAWPVSRVCRDYTPDVTEYRQSWVSEPCSLNQASESTSSPCYMFEADVDTDKQKQVTLSCLLLPSACPQLSPEL